jgi:hypothetical protein
MIGFLLLLVESAVSITTKECPVWNCTKLADGVCAQLNEPDIHITSIGCDKNEQCEKAKVIEWYKNLSTKDLRRDNDGVTGYWYDCEIVVEPVEEETSSDDSFDER